MCVCEVLILDEPLKLLRVVRAAVVSGPSVADGEFVELQHVHHADLRHRAAEQIRTLVNAGGCERIRNVFKLAVKPSFTLLFPSLVA